MSTTRADPFAETGLDVSAFEPKPAAKPAAPREAIREASERSGFPSRAPAKRAGAVPAPKRRRRTGRNVQLNIKVTQAVMERFVAVADKNGWAFGETLERALDKLGA